MIGFFRRRRYRRAFNAALVVLIGKYVFERLDAEQRRAVDGEVDRNIRVELQVPRVDRKWFGWADLGAVRAVAMARLGLSTGVPGYTWDELLSRYWWWKKVQLQWSQQQPADVRDGAVDMDFHPFHPATEDAKAFMRRNGYLIPDYDPAPPNPGPARYFDPLLDGTGLRKRLEERVRERDGD